MKNWALKILIYGTAVFAVYLLFLVGDVLLAPKITTGEESRALAYALSHNLTIPPIAFYHDGCTAFPDSLPGHDLYEACLNHDIAYWLGGSEAERQQANVILRDEAKATGPLGILLAPVMYIAVQHFGNNWVSRILGSNWGYGWN